MSYEFKISERLDEYFKYHYKINEHIYLNHNNEDYLSSVSKENEHLICFGYCFDVRSPKLEVYETLKNLLETKKFTDDLNYLNGQFLIIYNKDDELSLYTDASSLVPVYFSKEFKVVTNIYNNDSLISLNPNYSLNLKSFNVERFNSLSLYKDIEVGILIDKFMSLLKNQYQFFDDKNLNIIFQADNYHKALFSMLSPTLFDQNIVVRKIDAKGLNKKFGEVFSKEFSMNYFDAQEMDEFPTIEGLNYLARNNLSNFKALYQKKNNNINDEILILTYDIKEENAWLFNYELNLIDNYNVSNVQYSENFLIYEPLNVREILNLFLEINKRQNFNSNIYIIEQLKPSLNFYNFTNGKNLRDINLELKKENYDLKSNSISSKNQKFLMNVKLSDFRVSQNLDGKLKNDEIIVFPAKQKINKNTKYIIEYQNSEEGLIFIEGYYKNEKNAKRITVIVNNEEYNIFDFYGGRYFYFDGKIEIIFKYSQDYNHLSWQKAGTLRVKKMK